MRIYATTPDQAAFYDFWQSGSHYFRDTLLEVELRTDSVTLTDLTQAMRTGKKCLCVHFAQPWQTKNCELSNLLHRCQGNFKTLFDLLATVATPDPYKQHEVILREQAGTVTVRELPAMRVYSPFATLSALKEEPKKWTLPHVVRALLNNQYTDLRCTGYYTDDYAFDAASNFQKGQKSARHFVKELISEPSGWWTTGRDSRISVCCYSFDCNSFEFQLIPPTLTVQELITRYCLDYPNLQADRHPNGNALLRQYTSSVQPLVDLAAALKAAGARFELEADGPITYLAVYASALTSCPA